MHTLANDLQQFGKRMGFSKLELNDKNFIKIEIQRVGDFYIELVESSEEVLFYILSKFEFANVDLYWDVLAMCNEQRGYDCFVNPIALLDKHVGFLARKLQNQCNPVEMDKILKFFIKLINQLRQKHR